MISNQILQNTIEGLKGISRVDFCVLDTEGKELAATFDMAKDCGEAVLSFVESPADSQVIQGCQFFKIFADMFCLQMARQKMCICSVRLRHFRSRVCL